MVRTSFFFRFVFFFLFYMKNLSFSFLLSLSLGGFPILDGLPVPEACLEALWSVLGQESMFPLVVCKLVEGSLLIKLDSHLLYHVIPMTWLPCTLTIKV